VHVHAGVGSPFAAAGVRVALDMGFPVAVTVHCLPASFRLPDILTPWAVPEIAARVALNAVSEAAGAPLRERTGGPVTVVPNGLDPQDWAVEPVEHDPDVVEVVSTMRLSVRKRPLPMLAMVLVAQRRLADRRSPVRLRLTVFGDGKLMPRMHRFVRRHGMADTVRLAGRVNRSELVEIYRRADIFLAPAHLESFGIAALEARCAGLPVVAMRATGITEFVADRREGLLAEGDAGMTDALVELATDTDLRRGIAAHNRATVPPTAWSTVLETVNREYERAMAIRKAAA
jgi:glycosyltransferase involved in cell wall biosynthesis